MVYLADTIHCRCGNHARYQLKDISWIESGKSFTIRNIPTWSCNNQSCCEEIITSSVQLNVSFLAEDMRNGKLPLDVEYKELL
ncbi:hypothetical protein B5M42_004860 [Paenibacillus athensensis]|uniref:hypothetical protein n=1 Tax=Paenibacillus athensensis TaxID=1967502 RepID=UPI00106FC40F|nr:hypothetical protein [Paenibacillus athensensis]MCD1258169.1 hypothetical protein [Paenibacillus athensensis]